MWPKLSKLAGRVQVASINKLLKLENQSMNYFQLLQTKSSVIFNKRSKSWKKWHDNTRVRHVWGGDENHDLFSLLLEGKYI